MASIVNNLIEYSGLADEIPQLSYPACFKQFCHQETLLLPQSKPDINHIIKIMAHPLVTGTRIIKTSRAVSEEGRILTGRALIVEGELRQHVEYTSESPNQAVYAAHFKMPFCSSIVLHDDFKAGPQPAVNAYIEDIFAETVNERSIYVNIMILIAAAC